MVDSPRERAGDSAPRLITPEGYARLKQEADRLWRIERPKVTQEVSDAAALGDRSENAEYIYGKKRLREIDRRLGQLGQLFDRLTVVQSFPAKDGKVAFGAWVTVEDEEGKEHRYRLVGPDEVDVKGGRVSVESPMGLALLGRRAGHEVTVVRPKGRAEYTVTGVEYQEARVAASPKRGSAARRRAPPKR
jgi:transcription elongation factor GreB